MVDIKNRHKNDNKLPKLTVIDIKQLLATNNRKHHITPLYQISHVVDIENRQKMIPSYTDSELFISNVVNIKNRHKKTITSHSDSKLFISNVVDIKKRHKNDTKPLGLRIVHIKCSGYQ